MTEVDRFFLKFFKPQYIVGFLAEHPVIWHDREVCKRGGLADHAGMPPTPVIGEFHNWVMQHDWLPAQAEFSEFCLGQWAVSGWPGARFQDAVRQKIERNFYPSCIDMYHAFSLVATAGWFDRCSMDSIEDVVGKADLTFYTPDYSIRVNLKGPNSTVSRDAESYKAKFRGHGLDVVQIRLPYERVIGPGNKRWYLLSDFAAIQRSLPGVV